MMFFLTAPELAATRDRLAKINARAAKRGFTGRFDVVATPTTKSHSPHSFAPAVVTHGFDVEISGDAPCYGGWVFVAALDTVYTEQGEEVIVRCAPGEPVSDADNLRPGVCDHCKANRRRAHVYLVRSTETGEEIQVGSTCLKDFLGWTGNPVFIDPTVVEGELERFGNWGYRPQYDVVTVLAYALAAVRTFGYVRTSEYSKIPTRDTVLRAMKPATKADREVAEELRPMLSDGTLMARAEAIRDYLIANLGTETDYARNLTTLLRAGAVEYMHLGVLVSAISAYDKAIGVEVAREARAKVAQGHVGTVGAKLQAKGTVLFATWVSTQYGSSRMLTVSTPDGVVKMFTTAKWAEDVDTGDTVAVLATVKSHDEWQGRPETMLARPKLIEHKSKEA